MNGLPVITLVHSDIVLSLTPSAFLTLNISSYITKRAHDLIEGETVNTVNHDPLVNYSAKAKMDRNTL